MKLSGIATVLLLVLAGAAGAQTPAKPEETAKIKPLVAAETKAREALNAKLAALPEVKAFNDARDKLPEMAAYKAAQAALDKAAQTLNEAAAKLPQATALNKAVEALPENESLRTASAAIVREAYRAQAAHQLSHLEYKPQLNPKTGDLEFAKIEPPKSQ